MPVLEGDGNSAVDAGGEEMRISEVLPLRSMLQ